MDATLVAQLLVNGLVLGAIYALLAAGLSLIFGVLEVANFAHGALYMVGAFVAYLLFPVFGYLPTVFLTAGALAFIGLLLYQGLLSRLPEDRQFSRSIIVTIGVAMVFQNGAIFLAGAVSRSVAIGSTFSFIQVGDLKLPIVRLLAMVVATSAFLFLYLVLQHTNAGKAMRGISQNPSAALMVGIEPARIARWAMMLGIGLAGIAGAVLAPIFSVNPLMGVTIVFKAFAIVVIGGLGSIPGVAIVAIAIGIIESLAVGFGSTVAQSGLVFVLMIGILFLRPQGLFGNRVRV
jgi:branched-chain amino acid transport system permease protein